MKDRTRLVVIASLVLALLAPYIAHARGGQPVCDFVDTPRTRAIQANEPKTPDDLLRVLQRAITDQQMSGYDIAEQITGIARENWGKPHISKSTGEMEYFPYLRRFKRVDPVSKKIDTYYRIRSTTPYYIQDDSIIRLSKQGRKILLMCIGDFKPTFLMKPALARKFLGDPFEIVTGRAGSISLRYPYPPDGKLKLFFAKRPQTKELNLIDDIFTDKHKFDSLFKKYEDTYLDGVLFY
ncbi:MAG: hypothetical protein OEV73_08565 [Desulfobulbaceae bacterium]|nr:hypothetical protein [Desulfobulbaceae bacterium]